MTLDEFNVILDAHKIFGQYKPGDRDLLFSRVKGFSATSLKAACQQVAMEHTDRWNLPQLSTIVAMTADIERRDAKREPPPNESYSERHARIWNIVKKYAAEMLDANTPSRAKGKILDQHVRDMANAGCGFTPDQLRGMDRLKEIFAARAEAEGGNNAARKRAMMEMLAAVSGKARLALFSDQSDGNTNGGEA